jgi:TATA-box binding protein (TBP) (component of TFIID and TFIIIB)
MPRVKPPLRCAPVKDVVDDRTLFSFSVNNLVWAMRLAWLTDRPVNPNTFVKRHDGRTELNVNSLVYRSVITGGRFTPRFPAVVINNKHPLSSLVMFDKAVQVLGTRHELDAQLAVQSLCYRLNRHYNTTDMSFCHTYVCNMVSAFSLGHRVDLGLAAAHLPQQRITYNPRRFDGLEICMVNDRTTDLRITCIIFNTGSGVITGGSSREHHTDQIRILVRLMYAFALPKVPRIGSGSGSVARKMVPVVPKESKLYRLPPEIMRRDPRIPAPRVFPDVNGKATRKRRKDAKGEPSVAIMKRIMDGVYLPDLPPNKPFYTPIPGRVVIPNPDPKRQGTVLYYYMPRGKGACDHQEAGAFDYDPKVLTCRLCGEKARPYEHPEAHELVRGTSVACQHRSCSITLRQIGPHVVCPECDRCGKLDEGGAIYDRRVLQQQKALLSAKERATKRQLDRLRVPAHASASASGHDHTQVYQDSADGDGDRNMVKRRKVATSEDMFPCTPGRIKFGIDEKGRMIRLPSTRAQVSRIMQQHAQIQQEVTSPDGRLTMAQQYPRLSMTTADLGYADIRTRCVL